MHTLGLLLLPYSPKNNKPLTLYQRTRNLLFLLWTRRGFSLNTERFFSEHGSNGIIKQQLTALASAWWAPPSINNKRIIYQQLLFRTLQTLQTVYTTKRIVIRFRLRFTFSFICLKMSKNALWWQDGKMASEISNFLARTQEIFFLQKFFSCVRARDLQKTAF